MKTLNPKQYQGTNYKWSKQEIATLSIRFARNNTYGVGGDKPRLYDNR